MTGRNTSVMKKNLIGEMMAEDLKRQSIFDLFKDCSPLSFCKNGGILPLKIPEGTEEAKLM